MSVPRALHASWLGRAGRRPRGAFRRWRDLPAGTKTAVAAVDGRTGSFAVANSQRLNQPRQPGVHAVARAA